MSVAETIVRRHFAESGGELLIGGARVGEIVAQHGTPLFVYDQGVIRDKLATLRRALPAGFDVYYSIKANPNQALLRLFLSEGCGLEVASGGETFQALEAGCAAENVVFAGPGKTADELEYALSRGIGEIHVESFEEIETIASIAGRLKTRAGVAVRVNPAGEAQGGAMRMGGIPSPFGFDEETLDTVLDRVLARDALDFRGIHLFVGTQILDHETLLNQYRRGLEIARRAARRAGAPLATLDLGGGLGIPYFPGDSELDAAGLERGLAKLRLETEAHPELQGTRFIVEPGRYLVGESGVYVSRVTAVKQSRDKTYVVLDGGMHHHLAASGNLGQVIKKNFPVAVLNKLDAPAGEAVDAVGPLCTPLDVLARNVKLPQVAVGDLLGVFQSGAYARSASPLGFLSHPGPAEVLVGEGRARLIRRRGDYRGLLVDQCLD
jgi:diaminopimelate decarboxylase